MSGLEYKNLIIDQIRRFDELERTYETFERFGVKMIMKNGQK